MGCSFHLLVEVVLRFGIDASRCWAGCKRAFAAAMHIMCNKAVACARLMRPCLSISVQIVPVGVEFRYSNVMLGVE